METNNIHREEAVELFHALLRSVVSTGENVRLRETTGLLQDVISIAKAQDVLYLVCYGITKNGGLLSSQAKQEQVKGVYQFSQNEYLLKRAREVFESEKIPYIVLKGPVIRELYPEPWMRSCCDIDILVKEEDIDRAVQSLVSIGFSTENKKEYHDVSLYYGNAHLELHFNICENIQRIDQVLRQVWKYTEQKSEYEYIETDEFYAFHLIAHMLYHFLRGGCNMKQFVDLWLLRCNRKYDERKLQPLLSSCKLEQFYQVICDFTDDVFLGREMSELSKKIEEQVFHGGLVQRNIQTDNISILVSGGTVKYLFKSLLPHKKEMEWIYPSLRKHQFLLPFYYFRRLFSKTLGKNKKRARNILKANRTTPEDTKSFLKEMGLS